MTQLQFNQEEKTLYLNSRLDDESFTLIAYRAQSFKAFIDTDWVSVSGVVLFFGNNSAGKTAIVQPLLLLKYAYEKEKVLENVIKIWELESAESLFSDLHNVRSTEPIVISFKFITNEGKEAVISYYFSDNNYEESILEFNGTIININEYCDFHNVFFFEQKEELSLDEYGSMLVRSISQALRSFAQSFSFLRPHRVEPQREFILPGGKIGEIGIEGQKTYETLLSLLKGEMIDNKDINEWLAKFGYQLKWVPSGNNRGKIMMKDIDSGYSSNIVENGFGISQSLPLVVKMATINSETLLIDSPEAFLQTNRQGDMVDVILKCVNRGNSVLAETGSEHMLYRLRRRIVEKTVNVSIIHIYFITDEGTGNSKCEEVLMNEKGEVSRNVKAFNNFFSSDFDDLQTISLGMLKNG